MQLFDNEGQAPGASRLWALVVLAVGVEGRGRVGGREGGKLRKQELRHMWSLTLWGLQGDSVGRK